MSTMTYMSHCCSVSCICMLEYVMALISVPLVWILGSYLAPHLQRSILQ